MAWLIPFGNRVCRDAADIAMQFYERAGACKPLPPRAKDLIRRLNVEHFWWRPVTHASRVDMVNRIRNAVRPWGPTWR
jgi:hypothetical protein